MKYQSVVAAVNKASDTDIAWLAGIIDGEGSFSFLFTTPPSGRTHVKGRLGFTPQLSIGMIEGQWEQKMIRILQSLDIHFGQHRYTNKSGSRIALFNIQRWTHIITVARLAIPYLAVKHERAQLFLDFGNDRPKLLRREYDGKTFIRRVNWESANRFLDLVDAIRALNGKKQNVKWTRERITQVLKDADGQSFPSLFTTNNPRRHHS